MPTRYQQLRQAVLRLTWGADQQHAYLERILAPTSINGRPVGYGNDELALELDDIFCAAGEMRRWGEISEAEVAAVRPLDSLMATLLGSAGPGFWQREALWTDERWNEVRSCATQALASLPDEERDSGWLGTL